MRLILNKGYAVVRQPAVRDGAISVTMEILGLTHTSADCSETIVCRCLQVSESTIQDAIAIGGLTSVKQVCRETGAGGGCTACHARIREMLRRSRETAPVC